MDRRKWDPKTKTAIVLEGLKGRPIADICNEYRISQTQYYKWRDQFLANAPKLFEVGQSDKREARLETENKKLKRLVGELTYELKKSD